MDFIIVQGQRQEQLESSDNTFSRGVNNNGTSASERTRRPPFRQTFTRANMPSPTKVQEGVKWGCLFMIVVL